MPDVVVVVLAACCAALTATPLVRARGHRSGIVAHPNPIVASHTRPVAYLGGVAVAVGAAVGAGAASLRGVHYGLPRGLVLGTAAYLVVGLVDDVKVLRPAPKFTFQVLAAGLAIGGGVAGNVSSTPERLLACVWILIVVNAVNFTDVCDGLVAGLAAGSLGVIALVSGNWVMAAAAAGAALGFLPLNVAPASIYLGDAGAHVLGFLWAALAIQDFEAPLRTGAFAILIVGVPLFELVFITTVRLRKGLPWWRGSPDHFALRLQARGLSRRMVCAMAWPIGLVLAGCAVGASEIPAAAVACLLALVGIFTAVFWKVLLRWEVPPKAGPT